MEKQSKLKEPNKNLVNDFNEFNRTHVYSLKLEHIITFSLNILQQVKKSRNTSLILAESSRN